MTISFNGTGGLFTRLGAIGNTLYQVNACQNTLVNTIFPAIAAQYLSTLQQDYGAFVSQQTGLMRGLSGVIGTAQQLAQSTVIDMVAADQPAASANLQDAMGEVIRQMSATNTTVQQSGVGVTIAALGTPIGTGVVVYSTKRGDGLLLEDLFAETGRVVCTADSYSGGATSGQEQFQYIGQPVGTSQSYDYDWPLGSGAQTSLTSTSADVNANSSNNLLTNGNFQSWNAVANTAVLANWVASGTAGTDYKQDTSKPFRNTYDLELLAGTGATESFIQTFGSSTNGTVATLTPLTSYAVNFWLDAPAEPGAGVLTVSLISGSSGNTVVNDQQGNANSFTVALNTVANTYTAYNGTFRTPEVMPATYSIKFAITTALTTHPVYMSDITMRQITAAYSGGLGLAVFGGATPFVLGDTWTAAQTNNRGNTTFSSTFQSLFDRFFGMRSMGLLLPSAASGATIPDSLIT